MKQRFRHQHFLSCVLHVTMWLLWVIAVTYMQAGNSFIIAGLAATAAWFEIQLCFKYIERDRMSDLTLEENIMRMPLLELMEAISKRGDIAKIVVGDSPN